MSINNPFALNHILAPNLNIHDFFQLAKNLNIQNIEIRNDLPKISLYNINAKIIKELVNNYNVNILSINALQKSFSTFFISLIVKASDLIPTIGRV